MKYLVFLFIIITKSAFGSSIESPKVFFYQNSLDEIEVQIQTHNLALSLVNDNTDTYQPKHTKLKAILLAIFLGHFGVHRIYLGTRANVPVVYSLTLGGGFGLLPLIDIISILTTKDLSKYENNDKVIMWVK